ncbi:MAG: iron ABC transporter permease, partial [Aggregatibacter aphrophilus]|nr:iron ABC transporter permease [Aggregatibacter aphrophilus]
MNRNPPFWLTALIILISLPLILPFLYVVVRAVDVGWVRCIELLCRPRMWELLSNTLLLMVCVTTFSIILGTVCAFLLERYRFWGKPFFQVAMTLPLCIPAFVSCFTWISLTFRVEGFWGTIGIMTLSS